MSAASMTAESVLQILTLLRSHGVTASVDGGWGVDALLRQQTRPHEDLDLVVALEDGPTLERALAPLGYALVEDHRPVRFVMRDAAGLQLDFHTVHFDAAGGGVQPQPGGGSFLYPPEGFERGSIGGEAVGCISAEVQLLCHLGYEPTEKDAHDVLWLCRRFALAVPAAYRRFAAPLVLRAARDGDVAALSAIRRDAILALAAPAMGEEAAGDWADSSAEPRVARAIEQHEVWVAECDGAAAGWIEIYRDRIEGLYVRAGLAGSGTGSALLAHAESLIRSAGHASAALDASPNAEAFYHNRGYRPLGGPATQAGRAMRKPLDGPSTDRESHPGAAR